MKNLTLFFLLFCGCLNGNSKDPYVLAVTEGEPSTLVSDAVSALTGDFFVTNTDIVVQGAEPIILRRNYISGDGKGRQAGWFTFSHLILKMVMPPIGNVEVREPNGTMINYFFPPYYFKAKNEKERKKILSKPIRLIPNILENTAGMTNCAGSTISGRNNLKNNSVEIHAEKKRVHVYGANGIERCYQEIPHQKIGSQNFFYHLLWERLPNGNKINYRYDKSNRLEVINSTNESGTKVYAWVQLKYHGDAADAADTDVTTSDGRLLSYRFERKGKHKEDYVFLMKSVSSPEMPEETLEYHKAQDYRGALVASRSLPEGRTLKIDYYNLKHNPILGRDFKIESVVDPRCDRVKVLSSPVGVDSTLIPTHQFIYVPGKRGETGGYTEVFDAGGNLTVYRYSSQVYIECIERYSNKEGQYVLINSERFVWGSSLENYGYLICKSFHDEIGNALFARVFSYDGNGNILQEKIYGNLSGTCTAKMNCLPNGAIEENGIESYSKRFDYTKDGRNLRILEEEDNGKTVLYEYVPGKELIAAKFICDHGKIIQRLFFEYDEERILIREISDDGVSKDKCNLSGVTERKIQQITPRSAFPFIGMPHSVEERYLDLSTGQEISLKKVVLSYYPEGRVKSRDVYDAKGVFRYSLMTKYDSKGRVIEETNALGQVAKSSYDANGNKITFEDFHGKSVLRMTYDFANRLIQSEEETFDGKKRASGYHYDHLDNRIKTIDSYGNATSYVYDALGHVVEEHLPETLNEKGEKIALVARYVYDSAGKKTETISPKGEVTKTEFTARGMLSRIVYADGHQERFVYNLDGTLAEAFDQEGAVTRYSYDVLGRETLKEISSSVETSFYNSSHLISKTNAEGHATLFTYDGAGRKIADEFVGEKIEYAYDDLGRLYLERKEDLVTKREFDLADRVIEERMEDLSGKVLARTLYEHDCFGNVSCVTRFIGGHEVKELFIYDAFNRPIKQIDALGNATYFEYVDYINDRGQKVLLKIHTDALGNQTVETHDALARIVHTEKKNVFGQLLSKEELFYDAAGNLARQCCDGITTLWDYGLLNRLRSLTEATGTENQKITRYTYTAKGQTEQTIKPDGTVLENHYNSLGQLIQLFSSDGTISYQFHYNKLGQLVECENLLTNKKTVRELDSHGRLCKETLETGFVYENRYDTRGRRKALLLPDGNSVHYSYDALHLRTVSRYGPEATYTHRYLDYDLSGHLLREELIGNLGEVQYQVDALGRTVQVVSSYMEEKIEEIDPNGQIKKRFMKTDTAKDHIDYSYDDLLQLTEETGTFAHQFSYDSHYNRLSKDQSEYQVNSANELLATGPIQYAYDDNGCPILKKTPNGDIIFKYDALGRLLETITPEVSRLVFSYDGLHRRLSKTFYLWKNQGWEIIDYLNYIYDGQNEIGATDETGKIQQLRVLGSTPRAEIGAAIAIELSGKVYAPLHDLKGSVHCLVNLFSQSAHETYRYSAYGEEEIIDRSGKVLGVSELKNPWRYCSKRVDEETHLIFFGRRYYEPETGRWLTPDPKGFVDSMNLYAFVFNDPLTNFDLWGLETMAANGVGRMPFLEFFRPGFESVVRGINLIGRTIHQFFFHMVPIPIVRQFGMLFGNLLSGTRQPYYPQPHRLPIGDGHISESLRMVFVNGVLNNEDDVKENGGAISEAAGGTRVDVAHNRTRGAMLDLLECVIGKLGFQTAGSRQLARQLKGTIHEVGGPENGGKVAVFSHSGGGINFKNALKKLSLEERKALESYTFGSGELFDGEGLYKTQHYVSSRDFISIFSPFSIAKAKFSPEKSNVHILPSKGGIYGTDHGLLGGTYEEPLKKIVRNIIREFR